MGKALVKNDIISNEFRPCLFLRDIFVNMTYYLQQDLMLFDASWLKYVRYLVHIQTEALKMNITDTT